jgi:hypothetical protein
MPKLILKSLTVAISSRMLKLSMADGIKCRFCLHIVLCPATSPTPRHSWNQYNDRNLLPC